MHRPEKIPYANFILLRLRDGLYCLEATLSSASVLQAFFMEMGMKENTVSLYQSKDYEPRHKTALLRGGSVHLRQKNAAILCISKET